MSPGDFLVVIYSLCFQNRLGPDGIKCEVSETGDANEVRPLDAKNIVGEEALQYADDATTHDHHDQEVRSFGRVSSESRNSKRENARP